MSVGLATVQFELLCNDPMTNTVLVMPSSLSHHCLKGEDLGREEKLSKYCGDGIER